MAKVIGVKFKNSGKSYFFDPVNFDVHKDDHVIVETGKGVDYGFVVSDIREIADDKLYQPLKPILRKANERDEEQVAENHIKEKEAFRICQEKVHEHNLDMKLTEAEYAFDNSKILFYFTADGYVDFRELVKDLAAIFRTRIELRQIGVRDEARALGGLGACGRPMCCATYLADFVPVSIKMAKEQNLPLNPTKISGVCGRLMCCLKNEEDTYEELNKTMPSVGDIVEGNDGLQGEVFSTNVLRQLVKVLVEEGDEKELHEYEAGQITVIRKRKGKKNLGNKNEESVDEKTLEALEDIPESGALQEKSEGKRDNAGQGRGEGRDNRNSGQRQDRRRDNDNRQSGERRRDSDNRQSGEGRRDSDNRQSGEGRRDSDNRQSGEGRRDSDNRQSGEGRRDSDNRQSGEGRRDNDNRQNGDNKHNNDSRREGDNNRESGRRKHNRNFDRKSGEGTSAGESEKVNKPADNSVNERAGENASAKEHAENKESQAGNQQGTESGEKNNRFHGKKHYGKYHGHRDGQNRDNQNRDNQGRNSQNGAKSEQ